MTMPETESGLEPEERAEREEQTERAEREEREGALQPPPDPPDRGRRPRRTLIGIAAALLLGLLGWAIAASIDRSDGASSAERADAARVATWLKGSGSQVTALQGGSKALAADLRGTNLGAVAADANRLQTVVNTADAQPQIPDEDAGADWETALAEYSSAVQGALTGAGGSDPEALAAASGLLGAGDGQLAALNQRIQSLGG
jgi:hypothetical protein